MPNELEPELDGVGRAARVESADCQRGTSPADVAGISRRVDIGRLAVGPAGVADRGCLPIERLPWAYLRVDADFRVLDWNPAAEQIFGYSKSEALGQAGIDLLCLTPLDARLVEIFRRLRSGDMMSHSVNENRTKTGGIITCEWFNTPIRSADGCFEGVIALAQDVTQRISVDRELSEHANRLHVLSRRMIEMRDDERRHAAQELDREVRQVLNTVRVNLQCPLVLPVADRPRMRVLVVTRQPVVRTGLRACFAQTGDITIAGEVGGGLAASQFAARLQPDIAFLVVTAADPDGYETAAAVQRASPSTQIVIMSDSFRTRDLERAIGIGARGLLLLNDPPEHVVELLRKIHGGAACCSQSLRNVLFPGEDGFSLAASAPSKLQSLSERELRILVELGRGAALKQAARTLGVTYKSADYLKQRVMTKLHLHDRVELVRFAIAEGLVS